ncbi:MAG: IS91 family transposase, partial [Gemmatimonadetes bacterium]|nr:IS91 family transposase [Gemmatimonadota bacterium]
MATGPRAGHRVRRLLSDPIEGLRSGPLCFSARGFSLHAATRIKAEDRAGLERLCRYVTRPPLAAGRLQLIDADHLTFRLKTPWSDGTTHRLLSPLELIEKLAALIPPRRLNLVRYHG